MPSMTVEARLDEISTWNGSKLDGAILIVSSWDELLAQN